MNRNLFQNHRNPVNLLMHAIGIPLVIAAIPMFGRDWRWALGLLFTGILIQEFGHSYENANRSAS